MRRGGLWLQAANLLTATRLVAAGVLLFLQPESAGFYAAYIYGGLTDMLDGCLARLLGSQSRFGARLDSLADIAFVAVCAVRLLPRLTIPCWVWILGGVIAAVRAENSFCSCRQGQPRFLHTAANRAAGLLLFLLPLTRPFLPLEISGVTVCAVAGFAALQEGYRIRAKRQ